MIRTKALSSFLLLVLFVGGLSSASAGNSPFYLKAGDTLVFYGDSITEQNLYNQWIELYTVTRFPSMRVHFYGAGIGGDRVSGGLGGDVDTRLGRDVLAHHPSVVTVMLGMNDGGYCPLSEQIEATYSKGYEHIVASLHTSIPNARITVLGPSPFDDTTRAANYPGGYNSTLQRFGDLDRTLAQNHGDLFVNLNPPVVSMLQRAEASDPSAARLLIPDRVHPNEIVHWTMAEAVLQGWNAPSLVSSVSLDALNPGAAEARNATVQSAELNGETLRWEEQENALPLPFDSHNAVYALLLKFTDIQQQLNRELLQVTGLKKDRYTLTIDRSVIGTFSSADLSKGINLAEYETPMRDQAQSVAWLIGDRDQAHRIHTRMAIRKAALGTASSGGDLMDEFEKSLEDAIYDAAIPKSHAFALAPATAAE